MNGDNSMPGSDDHSNFILLYMFSFFLLAGIGYWLQTQFVNRVFSICFTLLGSISVFFVTKQLFKNLSARILVSMSILVLFPLLNNAGLRSAKETCTVVGKYGQISNNGKNTNDVGAEKVQLRCADGIKEVSSKLAEARILEENAEVELKVGLLGFLKI